MKFTDVLVNILKANGVSHVFGLQGGAVVHIFDSFEKSGVGVTYTNHEVSSCQSRTHSSIKKSANNNRRCN